MRISKENMCKSIKKIVLWLFPVLFLIDDILGFNGYQFTICGKSIRIILAAISVIVLGAYSVYVLYEERNSLFPGKICGKSLLNLLTPLDCFVCLFILGNFLWATLVPLAVRGEMTYALKDYSTVLVLVLYFPLSFLIRTDKLNLRTLEKIIYVLTLILAGWHCVMYVGETLHAGFYASYYDFIDIISFGTAVRSDVVYGYGITRIIQVTSPFLLPGVFLAIRYLLKGKYLHILSLVLFTFAICATFTKSIWFGYLFGLAAYLIPIAIMGKDTRTRLRSVLLFVLALSVIVILNYTAFGNSVFQRAFNTIRSEESIANLQEQLKDIENGNLSEEEINNKRNELKDALGTQEANYKRAMQNKALLSKWKQNPLFGFGYGSYTEECIRNEKYPYMYESTFPALLMKIGLIGCVLWLAFIAVATGTACSLFWKSKRSDVFWWLGTAISYALTVQTNPFLFTFSGFSILLFLLIACQEAGTYRRR
ncbi:MAG: O-antigen ligase family protein [Oscillospiraceae bacterium]|nr:O-antigen ligase family protein [Oscillospiraceae bacterium]